MGLDIFVMPMWRFLSGEYTGPVERLIPNVIRVGGQKMDLAPELARKKVASFQKVLSQVTDSDISWPDEGEVVFERQFNFRLWHLLRAYAAHQDHPVRAGLLRRSQPFTISDEPECHPGLARIFDGAPTRFKHLIVHADNEGFYFPCKLEHPMPLLPAEERWLTGSSIHLLDELSLLGQSLRHESDTLKDVRDAWEFMVKAAKASVDHRLPIVFDG